jgi:C_GCAxxG_C_C family probable redox protein
MDKDELARGARENFESGYNCAQAMTMAVNEAYGLGIEDIPRMMQPFGGGMARSDEVCGAVSGAVLSIGMVFGRDGEEMEEGKERCYRLAGRYMEEFRKLRGSTKCTGLLGLNLADPEERERASQEGVFGTKCPGIVEDSMRVLVDIVEGELGKNRE